MRLIAALAFVFLVACGSSDGTLVVQVRTDLAPQVAFGRMVVSIDLLDGTRVERFLDADGSRDWGAGVRVAELTGLTPGTYRATVGARAPEDDTLVVVERPVRVEVDSGVVVVTVLLTADCTGVDCPMTGGDPTSIACLAGRCVDTRCSEESPEECGTPECASVADCGAPVDCATRECTLSGACFASPVPGACPDGEYCDPARGCEPAPCEGGCGDGTVCPMVESCDDGNTVNWDGCNDCNIAEARVNTTVAGTQMLPAVSISSDGSIAIVWQSAAGSAPEGFGIYAQRFDVTGHALGGELRVDDASAAGNTDADVASAPDGSFFVVWEAPATIDEDVHGRRFVADGAPDGPPFVVNTFASSSQEHPAIDVSDASGRYVVVWQSDHTGDLDIYARRYDPDGSPLDAADLPVNSVTAGIQSEPRVAVGADGSFVVVWRSVNFDGNGSGVALRRFDATGNPLDADSVVNTTVAGEQRYPDIGMSADDSYVVVWQSGATDQVIAAQRFSPAGVPLGSEIDVSGPFSGTQEHAAVAAHPVGGFAVLWRTDDDGADIGGRGYYPDGAPISDAFITNYFTTGTQAFPAADVTADNSVGAWQSADQDGSELGIYGIRGNNGARLTLTFD